MTERLGIPGFRSGEIGGSVRSVDAVAVNGMKMIVRPFHEIVPAVTNAASGSLNFNDLVKLVVAIGISKPE